MFRVWSCGAALLVLATAAIMGGCGGSSPLPISLSLTPSSPQAIDQSQFVAITAAVTNDSSDRGVTWSLSGPGSLGSTTPLSVTYVSVTTSINSAQQATVTATSVADPTKTALLQITVNPYPQIPTLQTLANGTVGAPYSQTITLIGGTPPFQWSVYDGPIITGWMVGGAVPDGLTLNANSGTISGTPTGGGTWYFEATLTDATGATAINGFLSIRINSNVPPGNPIPFLNQPLLPTAVPPGSSGFTLGVTGTGFVSGATIDFNGVPLTTNFVDNEHLTATVPAADITAAETASVTVVNPPPGGGRSNVVYFQVGAPEASVNFANAPNSPFQIPEPFGITAADFNGDGKPDLAVAGNTRVYVLLGNGNGTFTPAAGSPLLMPSPPYDDAGSPYTSAGIVAGDFNRSGHLGLAIGEFQNEAVVIFFGNGDGTFADSSTQANSDGQATSSVTAADFNGDGNLDLVAVNYPSGVSPTPLLGYSDGAFNGVVENIQVGGTFSAAGDFNGDGKLDLVIDGVNVLLGNGDGTFTKAPVAPAVGGPVAVADFDGDGKLDLAVCDSASNNVTILLGNGDGTFTVAPGSPIAVGNQPEAIVTGDFNNDGKLDLAIANFGDGTITLLLGNGDGTFTQASGSPYAVGHGPIALAAADFSGDGKLDLAVANLTDGTISILLQQ